MVLSGYLSFLSMIGMGKSGKYHSGFSPLEWIRMGHWGEEV